MLIDYYQIFSQQDEIKFLGTTPGSQRSFIRPSSRSPYSQPPLTSFTSPTGQTGVYDGIDSSFRFSPSITSTATRIVPAKRDSSKFYKILIVLLVNEF